VNAINDAIAHLGCEVTDLPATPDRILAALAPAIYAAAEANRHDRGGRA